MEGIKQKKCEKDNQYIVMQKEKKYKYTYNIHISYQRGTFWHV